MGPTVQLLLVTPEQPDADFAETFAAVMQTGHVAAVLLRKAGQDDAEYEKLIERLLPLAQDHDVAVLLDDSPALVRRLGADGVHLTGSIKQFDEHSKMVKPEYIAGAGDIHTRHEAMLRGENGADYVMFGMFDQTPTDQDRELAEWWSEVFEVPATFADLQTPATDLSPPKCEFLVLGDNVWLAHDGAITALAALHEKFGDA